MLRDLQKSFSNALLQGDNSASNVVLGDGLEPADRLAIYRHHVFDTLIEVLKGAYPVVCRLVDERFFAYAADQYIRQQPPTGPCLFEFGASFAHFLAHFPPSRKLVYLPDVARLEWAMHRAWFAEDASHLDPGRLYGIAPDELASLTLVFDASVSYVKSPWPIDRIWHANQPDAHPDELVRLDGGGMACFEIRRVDDDVIFRLLDAGTFTWREALAERQPLDKAFESACAAAPDFNLTAAIQTLLAEGLAVDAIVPRTT